MSGPDGIWSSGRVALGVGLLVLLAVGVPRGPEPGEPVLVQSATTADHLAAILVRDTAAVLTWSDSVPPTRAVAALLAGGAAGGADVAVAVPDVAGLLRVVPPDRPVARRRAALRIGVRGEPDSDLPVTITGQAGSADTLLILIGPDGHGAASVAVEPSRPGAAVWTVRTPGAEAVAHAWVRPATPLRVLVWSALPGWESRWLVRALESAGMQVAVRQDLGRELAVTSAGASAPTSLEDLAAYDVLALVGAAADSVDALARRWVEERGGGLLLVGGGGSAPALAPWARRGTAADRPASEIAWHGPAEIVPLPDAEIVTRVVPVVGRGMPVAGAADTGAVPAGAGATRAPPAANAVFARAAYVGRGRIFASGLETWPWAMEAGLGAEHEAFWESVVEWLAGGLTDDVSLTAGPAQPWVRWVGRLEGVAPDALLLRRPGGAPGEPGVGRPGGAPAEPTADEAVPVRPAHGAAAGTVAFVPVAEGAHALEVTGAAVGEAAVGQGGAAVGESVASGEAASLARPPLFGTVAAPPSDRLTWTSVALEVGAAGGRILRAGDPTLAPDARPASPSSALSWIAFLILAALAVATWTARRVGGRP